MTTEEGETSAVERGKSRLQRLLAWWKQTRVARGLARYGAASVALLTGGIAYSALFSIFAALTVAFSIFTAVLGSNDELQQAVLDALNSALPGIVQTEDNPNGLVSPASLEFPPRNSWR
jgi:membrane protein